jgi:preprotein translocase subunit SecD
MQGALDIINRRVNLFGTDEPIIQRFGDDRIVVQLPGASGSITEVGFVEPVLDVADEEPVEEILRSVLAGVGFDDIEIERQSDRSFTVKSATVGSIKREAAGTALEERLGALSRFEVSSGIDQAKALIGGTARLEFKERTCTDISCVQFTDADIGLTGDDLSRAFARTDQVGFGWVVIIHFNNRGTDIFSDLTRRIVGQPSKRISFFMDDEELLAPVAQAWIRDGVTRITGNFTREEARTLAIQLEAGRLPVPLKLIQENDVDALLGSESLRNSLIAGLVGLGLVIVFMLAYYRMAGVVAAVALIFYSIVVLALFKLIPVTLTLSHIGGFILSIGMAVDANILIFERMKEEMRIGRTLASSMEVGFNRAWPAIRDGNVSTLFTCGVLLWFGDRLGGGLVTGFAISLGIGVLASMFTAVVLSRNLLQLLAWTGLGRRLGLFTPEGLQRTTQIIGGGR